MSSTPVTKPQQPAGALAGNLTHTTQRFAPVIAAALRDLSAGGDLEVSDPDLAVIQFYALTVYPHIIRSMFGISLDQRATQALLASGVDMFVSYYQAKGPAQPANTGLPRGSQASQETP